MKKLRIMDHWKGLEFTHERGGLSGLQPEERRSGWNGNFLGNRSFDIEHQIGWFKLENEPWWKLYKIPSIHDREFARESNEIWAPTVPDSLWIRQNRRSCVVWSDAAAAGLYRPMSWETNGDARETDWRWSEMVGLGWKWMAQQQLRQSADPKIEIRCCRLVVEQKGTALVIDVSVPPRQKEHNSDGCVKRRACCKRKQSRIGTSLRRAHAEYSMQCGSVCSTGSKTESLCPCLMCNLLLDWYREVAVWKNVVGVPTTNCQSVTSLKSKLPKIRLNW